jgi:4-diphosphocytidyl-2-C-methyl-D-erythritol kinase
VHVSTKDAYAGLTPKTPLHEIKEVLLQPVNSWKNLLINNFETSVFQKFPEIEKVKNRLYEFGATYACMSGSGATVFGLFEKPISLKGIFNDCDYFETALK